jgi:predicted homoserine dehydrogenase-like protein
LVANGLVATITPGGMLGKTIDSLNEVDFLIHAAKEAKKPISDYILCKGAPPGVMIVAENPHADRLGNYIVGPMRTKEKLGYVLLRPYHLCHLEALNTLRKIVAGEGMLIHNSAQPTFTVAAIAKRKIKKGETIERGAGGFAVRGVAVPFKENTGAVPICLLQNTPVLRDIEPGETLQFNDVDLAHSVALEIYQTLIPSKKTTPAFNQTYDLSWLTQTISTPAPSPKTRLKEKVPLA